MADLYVVLPLNVVMCAAILLVRTPTAPYVMHALRLRQTLLSTWDSQYRMWSGCEAAL